MLMGREDRLVNPGEALAVVEEFIPGDNVHVDSIGIIRSSTLGVPVFDVKSKVVYVKPVKHAMALGVGFSVVGLVSAIRQDIVNVEIYGLVSVTPTVRWVAELSGVFSGVIPISQIASEYIREVYDYYRVGDLILARTLNASNPYSLTTKPPQYGVIYALCSRCLTLMEPQTPKTMKCPRCGNVESRKVSILASSKILQVNIRRLLALRRW